MIREIKGRRGLFWPRWLVNEIVRWILGVHSPNGTIKINNTANPGNERSIALDVDMDAVISEANRRNENRGLSKAQREDARDVVRACLDGNSLTWGDGAASVNSEWLEQFIRDEGMEQPGAEQPASTQTMPSGGYRTSGGTVGQQSNLASMALDTFTAGAPGGEGRKIMLCCRGADTGGVNGALYWREFTITSDGRIYAIDAESDSMGITTDQ